MKKTFTTDVLFVLAIIFYSTILSFRIFIFQNVNYPFSSCCFSRRQTKRFRFIFCTASYCDYLLYLRHRTIQSDLKIIDWPKKKKINYFSLFFSSRETIDIQWTTRVSIQSENRRPTYPVTLVYTVTCIHPYVRDARMCV